MIWLMLHKNYPPEFHKILQETKKLWDFKNDISPQAKAKSTVTNV